MKTSFVKGREIPAGAGMTEPSGYTEKAARHEDWDFTSVRMTFAVPLFVFILFYTSFRRQPESVRRSINLNTAIYCYFWMD